MSIIYISLCSLLFALHLDWSLNTSVDKKIIFSFYIFEIVFHFSLLVKLKIFFSLVLFSLDIHHRSRKKLTGKKLNADRQFFKDALCVILLQEGVGQYQFLGTHSVPWAAVSGSRTSLNMPVSRYERPDKFAEFIRQRVI